MQPTIRQGSRGEAVEIWQRVLGPPIADDGIFGPKTLAATKEWQGARNLVMDGIVGPKTWGAADQEASIQGVRDFVEDFETKTQAADQLKQEFLIWYGGLTPVDKAMETVYREAVNRRNALTVANSKNSNETKKAKRRNKKRATREEIRKKKKKTDDAGNYQEEEGTTAASASKEVVPDTARPVIKRGSVGKAVKTWQKILGNVVVDGKFGKITQAATKAWQTANNLVPDGIVGTATWGAALANAPPIKIKFKKAATTKVAGTKKKPKQVKPGQIIPKKSIDKPPIGGGTMPPWLGTEQDLRDTEEETEHDERLLGIKKGTIAKYASGIAAGVGMASWGIVRAFRG